ncbi:MAG TPA: pilus (MSHA type) biogenesis protein MshL [Burkholderiales bacterium]|nr:pilus (MSHA type) biogenesis protein MshL [Burkholderiales bacterium]
MRRLFPIALAGMLGACANNPAVLPGDSTYDTARQEMAKAARTPQGGTQSENVDNALLPPLAVEMPKVDGRPIEPRFDLAVNNAPAGQVFMAIVSGTRYSMVVHPGIKDTISVNLRDVTVFEALDTIREVYGYEYKVQGNRILIEPLNLQTRVYQVNYLMSQRKGKTEVRVTSGAISDTASSNGGGIGAPSPIGNVGTGTGVSTTSLESSRISTTSNNDFWAEIEASLRAIVGKEGGRNVVISPQAGVIVVRAMPGELRNVSEFLKTMQVVVERQVMLEAKIIDVQLSDSHQTGVNWAAFGQGPNSRVAGGLLGPGATLTPSGTIGAFTSRNADGTVNTNSLLSSNPAAPGAIAAGTGTPGTLFGLAFQTSNFAALISFLETQGNLQVLSSPRIATLNNQKAVLKVGTDEFFVTNITTNTTTTGITSTQSPTITVAPFFSGVALDVTPQIDENNQIILHVHPSVSSVIEKTKNIDLGTAGNFRLPLASSTVSESDTVVRVSNSNIVAIGGLMKESAQRDSNGVPVLGTLPLVGNLFSSKSRSVVKSELVILIKPTVIENDASWRQDILDTRERIDAYEQPGRPGSGPASGGSRAPAQ